MLSSAKRNMLSKIRDVLVEDSDYFEEHHPAGAGDTAETEKFYSETSSFDASKGFVATPVLNGDGQHSQRKRSRTCRFCYSEEAFGEWLSPCKCSGSIKWVHDSCFSRWLDSAPLLQQVQCTTCKYVYKKTWKLKPYKDWCLPDMKSTQIEVVHMTFDAICTYKLLWTCKDFYSGRRSVLAVLAGISFWRLFVITDRRVMYWANLFRCLASSIFQITVVNAS